MQKKNLQISLVLVVLLLALVFYIYQDLFKETKVQTNDSTIATSTDQNLINIVDRIEVEREEDIKINEIPKEHLSMPDLDREISFPVGFPEDAQLIMIDRINVVIKDIKNNPESYADWMSLGLQMKTIEDYKGAELAWEYAKYLDPDKFLAWSNLGDLNAYYIRDNVKAEENYIKALERGGNQIPIYFKVVEFYRDFLNNTEKAIKIVELGLEHNPNSEDLQNLLNFLK